MPEIVWTVEEAPELAEISPAPTGAAQVLLTFRDTIRAKSPAWLQVGLGEKFLYAIGLHMDAFIDALTAGVRLRYPGVHSNESLPYLGRDRRIRRGRAEPDGTYATRLKRWLDDHQTRGGPYAMLAQLHAHYAAAPFEIHLLYRSGRRFKMDTSGNVTIDDFPLTNVIEWPRWTLYFFWPTGPVVEEWGDGNWGGDRVWGSNLSQTEVTDLRLVPKEWNAAHCFGRILLLTPDVQLWGYPETNTWGGVGLTWGSNPPVTFAVE
jgi:hypothetical protein